MHFLEPLPLLRSQERGDLAVGFIELAVETNVHVAAVAENALPMPVENLADLGLLLVGEVESPIQAVGQMPGDKLGAAPRQNPAVGHQVEAVHHESRCESRSYAEQKKKGGQNSCRPAAGRITGRHDRPLQGPAAG